MQSEAGSLRRTPRPGMAGMLAMSLVLSTLLSMTMSTPLHAQTEIASSAVSAAGAPLAASATGTAITSVERADDVLREVGRQRTAIAAKYIKEQQDCATVFLMTRCLDAARERRREALAALRAPEIEANAFKRRARVAERDQVLEEKRLKSEQETSPDQRALGIRETRKAGATGQPGDQPQAAAGKERVDKLPKAPLEVRPEREASQRKPKPIGGPISPAVEASNRAAFDRKAAESAERQRVIAAKKAEKGRDRAARKAREAAVQTAAPAAP